MYIIVRDCGGRVRRFRGKGGACAGVARPTLYYRQVGRAPTTYKCFEVCCVAGSAVDITLHYLLILFEVHVYVSYRTHMLLIYVN